MRMTMDQVNDGRMLDLSGIPGYLTELSAGIKDNMNKLLDNSCVMTFVASRYAELRLSEFPCAR